MDGCCGACTGRVDRVEVRGKRRSVRGPANRAPESVEPFAYFQLPSAVSVNVLECMRACEEESAVAVDHCCGDPGPQVALGGKPPV